MPGQNRTFVQLDKYARDARAWCDGQAGAGLLSFEVCDFAKRGISARPPVRKQGSQPRTSQTSGTGCVRQPAALFPPKLGNQNRLLPLPSCSQLGPATVDPKP